MGQTQKALPLRQIVGHVKRSIGNDGEFEYFVNDELLECGHQMRPRQDMFGTTNAQKRRCERCAEQEPTDA